MAVHDDKVFNGALPLKSTHVRPPSRWLWVSLLIPLIGIMLICVGLPSLYFYRESLFDPLQTAARRGDATEASRLIASGVSPDGRCRFYGFAALHAAAVAGQPSVAKVLLEAHALVDIKDDEGDTPLHRAVLSTDGKGMSKTNQAGRNAVARMLLEHGADPKAVGYCGETPLHGAVQDRNLLLVKCLLEYGADPTVKDHDGYTPLDEVKIFCRGSEIHDMTQLLQANAATQPSASNLKHVHSMLFGP